MKLLFALLVLLSGCSSAPKLATTQILQADPPIEARSQKALYCAHIEGRSFVCCNNAIEYNHEMLLSECDDGAVIILKP